MVREEQEIFLQQGLNKQSYILNMQLVLLFMVVEGLEREGKCHNVNVIQPSNLRNDDEKMIYS